MAPAAGAPGGREAQVSAVDGGAAAVRVIAGKASVPLPVLTRLAPGAVNRRISRAGVVGADGQRDGGVGGVAGQAQAARSQQAARVAAVSPPKLRQPLPLVSSVVFCSAKGWANCNVPLEISVLPL